MTLSKLKNFLACNYSGVIEIMASQFGWLQDGRYLRWFYERVSAFGH